MRRRTRLVAMVAVFGALTAGSIAGATVAAYADSVIEFSTPSDNASFTWSSTPYVFSGTTTNTDSPITVLNYTSGSPDVLCTTGPSLSGDWSCAAALTPGSYEVHVEQSTNSDVVFFDVLVPAPTVDQPDPLEVPYGGTATYSGYTTYYGPDVFVDAGVRTCLDESTSEIGEVWSCEMSFVGVAPGSYPVAITQQVSGAESVVVTRTINVGSAPAFAFTSPTATPPVNWQSGSFLHVAGTSPDLDNLIQVKLDGASVPACDELLAGAGGVWSCAADLAVAPGNHTLIAYQGTEQVEVNFDVVIPAPGLDNPNPVTVDDSATTIDLLGSGLDNMTVYAAVRDHPDASCSQDTIYQTWACTLDISTLGPGTYTIDRYQRPIPDSDPGVQSEIGESTLIVTGPQISYPADGDQFFWGDSPDLTIWGSTTNLTDPIDVSVNGVPVCSNLAPTSTWTCVAPPPDVNPAAVIQVTQGTSIVQSTFQVIMPAPILTSEDPVYAHPGDPVTFTGLHTYNGTTIIVIVAGEGASCEDTVPANIGDPWQCDLIAPSLEDGTYSGGVYQLPPSGPFSTRNFEFVIGDPPALPQVQCDFSPGGVRIHTDDPNVSVAYYPIMAGENGGFGLLGPCSGRAGNTPETVSGFGTPVFCNPECNLPNLAPGLHDVYFYFQGQGEGPSYDYFFTVPNAPHIDSSAASGSQILVTGSGTPGNDLRLYAVGSNTQLCSTHINDQGRWACAFKASSASAVRAVDIDFVSRGMSPYSASRTIPVAPAPGPTPTPLPTLSVISWNLDFGDGLDNLQPGDTFIVTSDGLPAGTNIEIWMHSTPVLLTQAVATGSLMTFTLTVPQNIEAGHHTLELIATAPDGTLLTHVAPATVHIVPAKSTPSAEDIAGHHGNVKHANAGSGDRNNPAGDNALSGSIATIQRVSEDPIALAFAAGLALALLFLVALPTELLNSSLSSNSSRLGRIYGAVDGAMNRARDWLVKVTRSRAITAAIIVLVVSLAFGFIDPSFGFDLASLRLVLSLAIAFFLLSYGASWISGLFVRRFWGASSVVVLQPSIVLFAIVGVVVARLLDFSPGFLVGVAIGLELIRATRKAALAAVLIQFGMVVAFSLIAWVGYSILALGAPPADFGSALVRDTLVAVTAEGLMGAMVAVFPLRFLDGRELFEKSKLLWALCFVVVASAFTLLVLPTALEGTNVGDVGVWVLVFLVFGVISLVVWWILARADKRAAAEEPESEDVRV